MSNLIPPIGTRGLYSLAAPFDTALEPTELYKCAGIRSFKDIENNEKDVYETYYAPYGLTQAETKRDRKDDVVIVTLISDTYAPIYVPSSYIKSYPNLANKNYQRIILSADLGPLPDYLDLTFVKDQVATAVSQSFGVVPTVNVAVAPMGGVVTSEEADAREAARQAAIKNSTTDYAKLLKANQTIEALQSRLAVLEQIVRDHNLIG